MFKEKQIKTMRSSHFICQLGRILEDGKSVGGRTHSDSFAANRNWCNLLEEPFDDIQKCLKCLLTPRT